LILYADGGSRGNPGPAGAGVYLTDLEGAALDQEHRYLGEATNNVAEYSALILGLEVARPHQPERLIVRMDSQLVIRQLLGEYKVKQAHLKPLFNQARELLASFPTVALEYIPREENSEADALANQAMDEALSS
jgi:ribonuclease HI